MIIKKAFEGLHKLILFATIAKYSAPRRSGGIGRRAGLKIRRGNTRAGSTPAFGTTQIPTIKFVGIFVMQLILYPRMSDQAPVSAKT